MPMAIIHKVGAGDLYSVHFLDRTDPGYGGGIGGGVDPGYGHGGVLPPHIGNRPPGSGNPAFPDHSLPETPPPQLKPGETLVLVRSADGKWHYASLPPGTTKPVPLPPEVAAPKPA